ncbi:MAG: hypothetical protein Q4Q21_08520, partial [Lachnospiraceae bacterium]|nr:hypothetical protein [Lachnospiraceae bacterium]
RRSPLTAESRVRFPDPSLYELQVFLKLFVFFIFYLSAFVSLAYRHRSKWASALSFEDIPKPAHLC